MRQLVVQVPRGHGQTALMLAKQYQGANLASFEATGGDGPIDVILVHVSNNKVEALLNELQRHTADRCQCARTAGPVNACD